MITTDLHPERFILNQNELYACLHPTVLQPVLTSHSLRVEGWVGLVAGYIHTEVLYNTCPKMVSHSSIRPRATPLMHPMLSPLYQTATKIAKHEENTDHYQRDRWTNFDTVLFLDYCCTAVSNLQRTRFRTNQSDNREDLSSQHCITHQCIDRHQEYDNVTSHFGNDMSCCSHLRTCQKDKALTTTSYIRTCTCQLLFNTYVTTRCVYS